MKYLAYLLTVCLFFCSPVVMADDEGDAPKSAAETRMEKKDAADWYKKKLARQKKAVSALKKVKNEKTAKKAAATIMKHYGKLVGGKQTAMGSSGPAEIPENESMDAMAEKYEKQLEKLQEQLNAEIERIGELEIDCKELDEAIEAVNTY
ncbi:MAG: hypothetical protein IJA81_09565 [Akkermansia sp.]|nr:hypothetical protein [Akkermansia sp.]MBQ9095041.1 hypothetical protein [Akkermansia sp.]